MKPGTKLVMWIPDGRYVQDRQVGEAVAGYLREVGFDIQIVKMEWATYIGRVAQKPDPVAPYDLAMLAWAVGTQDADWGMGGTFLSTNWPPRAFNLAFYKSDVVDNALAAGRATTDSRQADRRLQGGAQADHGGRALGVPRRATSSSGPPRRRSRTPT